MDPVNPKPTPPSEPKPNDSDAFPLPVPAAGLTQSPEGHSTEPHFDPPAFHNPLADHQYDYAQQPAVAPGAGSVSETTSSISDEASITPPTTRLNIELPPEEPIVYTGPVPAPVRLAPAPRADDHHALAHQQTASQTPFSGQAASQPPVAPAALPTSAPAAHTSGTHKAKWRLPVIIGGIGLLIAILAGWQFMAKRSTPQVSTTPQATVVASVRSREAQPLQGGNTKVETPCYVIQVPVNPTVNNNAACKLDLTYGEQKISSIIISTYRDVDLVSPTGSSPADGQAFDQKKFLEELITNTTTGRTVIKRESISVGNLPAEKLIIGEADKPTSQVAYTYIVLPESDQQFNEKKFIAFIVTGAYGDTASQQGYNNVLKWWYWK